MEWSRAEFCQESIDKSTLTHPRRHVLMVMAMVETALAATTSRARGLLGSHMAVVHADRCLPFDLLGGSESSMAVRCGILRAALPIHVSSEQSAGNHGGRLGRFARKCGVCTADSAVQSLLTSLRIALSSNLPQKRRELKIGLYEYLQIVDMSSFASTR